MGDAFGLPSRSHFITLRGSGVGDYTAGSASYVDVDSKSLAISLAIPAGRDCLISVNGTVWSSQDDSISTIALADGTAVLREVVASVRGLTGTEVWEMPLAISYSLVGDGITRDFRLRYKTSAAANSGLRNGSLELAPTMTFLII